MLDVRRLGETDLDAAWRLSGLAFGSPRREPDPAHAPSLADPVERWGGFDETGRLVAKVTDLHHEQWWGGRIVPASGIAGVAVESEHRGRGATRSVLTEALHGARERGAAVAALFCTSSAVYRSLGFEVGGIMRTVDIPTATLPRHTETRATTARAADGRDWPAVRAVYDEVARTTNGLLTRRGRAFAEPTGSDLPDGIDGVTLAIGADGEPVGYASWQRGKGYDDATVFSVLDCLALTPDAARVLVSVLASWGTVAPTMRFRLLPWLDPVAMTLPLERAREHTSLPWMHRPVDVAAAVEARGWPDGVRGSVTFRLVDPLLPWNDGAWRLVVDAGRAALERADTAGPALDVRGWSLLWCGAARAAQLRHSGLLAEASAEDADALDRLLGSGGPAGALDYF